MTEIVSVIFIPPKVTVAFPVGVLHLMAKMRRAGGNTVSSGSSS